MSFLEWQRDLERREAEACGDDLRRAIAHLDEAHIALFKAQNENWSEMIVRVLIGQAVNSLRHAADVLDDVDRIRAAQVAALQAICEVSLDTQGFPAMRGFDRSAVALRRKLAEQIDGVSA